MTEKNKRRNNLIKLAECSVMLALSVVLSFIEIWKMPMGGGITLLSMLPVCLIAVKYGTKGALPTAFLYSVIQFAIGFSSGNVFVYCVTPVTWIVCLLFDYIVPFSVLGFSGIFRKKFGNTGIIAGIALMIGIRFVCHYITGVAIWGQWAEDMSPYLYSLIYNVQYMLPECILTSVAAGILIKIPSVRKLLAL